MPLFTDTALHMSESHCSAAAKYVKSAPFTNVVKATVQWLNLPQTTIKSRFIKFLQHSGYLFIIASSFLNRWP